MIDNEVICVQHNKRGLSDKGKPQKDCQIELVKQLNYHTNDDEAFKSRHKTLADFLNGGEDRPGCTK